MMQAKQPQKNLRLVSEPPRPSLDGSSEYEQLKRQLEHVTMLLNAALLAATKPLKPARRPKR
jgi:hypothetical protein